MTDYIESMLGEPSWQRRMKRLKYKVTVDIACSPYEEDEGFLELTFTDLAGPRPHPQYAWVQTGVYTIAVKLSIMPEGCGMVVVSSLWCFTKSETKKLAAFLVDLLTEYARRHVRPDDSQEEVWGRTLLATTNYSQRVANTYFRRAGWKLLTTTNNPRGSKMWLWEKKL